MFFSFTKIYYLASKALQNKHKNMETDDKPLKIIMLGSGNVATQIALALKKDGYDIFQVWSRTKKHAEELAGKVFSNYITDIGYLYKEADLYIISVSDDAIEETAKQAKFTNQMVVHTAGSLDMDVLKPYTRNYGVLYPLQTLSKMRNMDLSESPLCIEANNKSNYKFLQEVAEDISKNVYKIDSKERLSLHIAAVYACNFVNHMYAMAEEIISQHQLNWELLHPLIQETAEKIKYSKPSRAQTGPAVRKDKSTLDKHLNFLTGNEKLQKLYSFVSDSIWEYNKNKEEDDPMIAF